MIENAIPHLEDGQIVVFNPDNFASIIFKGMLKKRGIAKDIKIAGTESLLYATRRSGESTVDVWGMKASLSVGVLPVRDTDDVVAALRELFTEFAPASDALTVSLANVNMILHCPTVILNAGRIEDTNGNFEFYWEGMTESVCKVMETMDQERIEVAEALGLRLGTTLDYIKRLYPKEHGDNLHGFLTRSRVHGGRGANAPGSLRHRYLVEDVASGLVPVSALGDLVDVPTPTVDSIIQLAAVMNGVDYLQTGRNLEALGLSGMSPGEIMSYITE
jgi:opine dehydrogenase